MGNEFNSTNDHGGAHETTDQFADILNQWESAYREHGRDLAPQQLAPHGDGALWSEIEEAIECLKRFDLQFVNTPAPNDSGGFEFEAPGYTHVDNIDEGGQGRVFLARESGLDRNVAIKQPRPAYAWHEQTRVLLEQEARIASRLEHPGVIPIYGIGKEANGQPFYVMRYVKHRRTLASEIEALHAMPDTPERTVAFKDLLRDFVTVCRTIEFAHHRGVVHRDIKPANIMVGEFGEVFVVDWGLAAGKVDSPSHWLTMVGAGTPGYMSPEQAVATEIEPPSDVFSLGATLYHILTGSPPYTGETRSDVLARVEACKFPPPVCRLERAPGLEAVCRKAMAKDPEDRYTAKALADDLGNYLAGEAVSAWQEPWTMRVGRWLKRRRALVTGVIAAVLVTLISVSVAAVLLAGKNNQLATANEALDNANQNLDGANQQLDGANRELQGANHRLRDTIDELEKSLYLNQFLGAYHAWRAGDLVRAGDTMQKMNPELASFELGYLQQLARGNRELIFEEGPRFSWIVVSENGNRALLQSYPSFGFLNFEKQEFGDPSFFENIATRFTQDDCAISPDGSLLAIYDDREGILEVHDTNTGRRLHAISIPGEPNNAYVRFVNNGTILFAHLDYSDEFGKIGLPHWRLQRLNATSGKPTGEAVDLPKEEYLAYVSRRGNRAIIYDTVSDKHPEIYKIENGDRQPVETRLFNDELVAFSRDETRIANVDRYGTAWLWNADTGDRLHSLPPHVGKINDIAFSADGSLVATAGADARIIVSEVKTRRLVATLIGHRNAVNAIRFLPDGKILSAGVDKTTALWSLTPPAMSQPYTGHGVRSIHFSSDGNEVYYAIENARSLPPVRVYHRPTEETRELPLQTNSLCMHTASGIAAGYTYENKLEIWNTQTSNKLATIDGVIESGPIAMSDDGRWIAAKSLKKSPLIDRRDGESETDIVARATVLLINVKEGRVVHELNAHEGEVFTFQFTGDSKRLGVVDSSGMMTLWNVEKGSLIDRVDVDVSKSQNSATFLWEMAFSPDGRWVAVSDTGAITIRNTDDHHIEHTIEEHAAMIEAYTFSPDSRRLATVSRDKSVKLWDVESGQLLMTLNGLTKPGSCIAFSPDGKQLAAGSSELTLTVDHRSYTGEIVIWRADRPEPAGGFGRPRTSN